MLKMNGRPNLLRFLRLSAIVFWICLAGSASVDAGCPPWRPCGAGNTWGGNRLVRQGFQGADFRPACANHDACLKTCASRADCDCQLLNDLNAACDTSSNPRACYRKARQFYAAARIAHALSR